MGIPHPSVDRGFRYFRPFRRSFCGTLRNGWAVEMKEHDADPHV
jgi:hypothetical protein